MKRKITIKRRLSLACAFCLCATAAAQARQPAQDEAFVEGGRFMMGADAHPTDEKPAHEVEVSSFIISRYETTLDEFAEFVEATGYKATTEQDGNWAYAFDGGHLFYRSKEWGWRNPRFKQGGDHPVTAVSWVDAVRYSNWKSLRDGLTPAYREIGGEVEWDREANGWRLPTEAEWEYAAKGGRLSKGFLYSGSNTLAEVACYDENSHFATIAVGSKLPNELGIFDMTGNVDEWCWDRYGSYVPGPARDPAGPETGIFRVYRGGSWYSGPWVNVDLRVTTRGFDQAQKAFTFYGVRLVRNP